MSLLLQADARAMSMYWGGWERMEGVEEEEEG